MIAKRKTQTQIYITQTNENKIRTLTKNAPFGSFKKIIVELNKS